MGFIRQNDEMMSDFFHTYDGSSSLVSLATHSPEQALRNGEMGK